MVKLLEGGVVLGAIYIPPAGRAYGSDENFDTVEQMNDTQSAGLKKENRKIRVILTPKLIIIATIWSLTDHDAFENLEGVLDQNFIKLEHKNQDKHELDLFGQEPISLCKISNLQIVNGRLG